MTVYFCRGLSNTPKVSPIDEGHQQPDSPEVSSRETYYMKVFVGGVENVGKRTPLDPMEMGCHVKTPSDSPQVCLGET